VRISAGRRIASFDTLQDEALLARLPAVARGQVLVTNLKEQGISDYGLPAGGFGKDGLPGLELFIDDQPLTLARYPNQGFMRVVAVHGETPREVRGTRGTVEGVIEYADERPARWTTEKQPMVLGYWFWDWAEYRHLIDYIDIENKRLELAAPYSGYGYRAGQWFYGFNLFGEIDAPGEWYLDRETGDLFVWPPEGTGREFVARVSLVEDIVRLEGVSDVIFKGITFAGARRHGLVIKDGERVRIESCSIINVGSWAVRVEGGQQVEIVGCDISGTGDGGIVLRGGDRPTLTAAGHRAENNHIHHYSRWNHTYRPAISLHGVGNAAVRNLIHHAPHQAIAFGGNDMLIEGNEIHNVCAESNDAGAIYALRDWSLRGHVIRYNYLHHLYGHAGKGCHGVYLDDQFSSAQVYGNIFAQTYRPVLFGGGRDNALENNIFYQSDQPLYMDARGLGWAAGSKQRMVDKLERMPYRQEPWRSRYPQLLTLLDDEPMTPKGTTVARNIFWGGEWKNIHTAARPYVEFTDNLIDVDPLFVDAESGDFRLRPESPALALGFVPIPLEKIGLYEPRASWPVEHEVTLREFAHKQARRRLLEQVPVVIPLKGSAILELAQTPSGEPLGGSGARAEIARDGEYLSVVVEVPVEDVSALVRQGAWGRADGLEVCFRLLGEGVPGRTWVVQGFVDGRKQVSAETLAPGEEAVRQALEEAIDFEVVVGANSWLATFAIPLAAVGQPIDSGLGLDFNIGVRRVATDEWICWRGTGAQNWQLDYAGRIAFE